MSGTIFLAGILQFQSRPLFEEALEALRTEEDYSEQSSLVTVFQDAMISETIMVLRHHSKVGGAFYERLMAEAYLLTEFAGRGYIAGVLSGGNPKVQVAMAAMTHPVEENFVAHPDPELATDYLPRLAHHRLSYSYRSEGREADLHWISRPARHGKWDYISFPEEGSDDPANDWWDGHYYLKSGHQWYAITTDLDAQALRDPAAEEIQLIMDGSAKPGHTFFSYVPGTESLRLYTHEGYEDIETPFGDFPRCMKVRVDLYFLPTDEGRYATEDADRAFKKVTTTHYFGKGAGLVKLLFQEGELVLCNVEAGSAEIPANETSTNVAPQRESASTGRDNLGRKPWWKFW